MASSTSTTRRSQTATAASRQKTAANKAAATPVFQLSKLDAYVRQLRFLARAEYPSDTLERMMAVVRLMLCCMTDLLRPSSVYRDTPHVLLGAHNLTERELGPSGTLDGFLRGYVQEISTYDQNARPFGREEQGTQVASMSNRLFPKAVMRHKGAIKGKGPFVEIDFNASGEVWFSYHEEEYNVSGWPKLILEEPLSLQCLPDYIGDMEITCKASGLVSNLHFKPGHNVTGSINRLLGHSADKYCSVEGKWSSKINVSCPALGAEGTLYDAKEISPLISASVNLQTLGPQQLPRLWSAIMDAILYSEVYPGMPKAARDLADHVAMNLIFSLDPRTCASAKRMKAVRNAGGAPLPATNSKKHAGIDSDDDDGTLYTEEKYDSDPRSLPPCVKEQRAKGRAMHHQIHLNLRLVPNPYLRSGGAA